MGIDYKCPHCNGYLNLEDKIVFSVTTKNHKKGLIFLHTELGNYSYKKHPGFTFEEGEELEFFCPVCHTPLASETHKKLAKVIMVDENKNEFEVLFSKVAGEKSTYKIEGETMEAFGDDSAEYLDFLNLTMNF